MSKKSVVDSKVKRFFKGAYGLFDSIQSIVEAECLTLLIVGHSIDGQTNIQRDGI